MRLRCNRIVTPAGTIDGEVVVREGQIAEVVPGRGAGGALELGDRWLVPGFIDTHVHGGGCAQCNTDHPEEVVAVADFHARHGTTSLLATTVAAPLDELEAALRAIAACASRGGGGPVLGSHLAGPFLSREMAG